MTIVEYAMYRAACQRMTPAELEIAMKAEELAEAGEPGAREMLRKMIHDVLCIRYLPKMRSAE